MKTEYINPITRFSLRIASPKVALSLNIKVPQATIKSKIIINMKTIYTFPCIS